MKIRTDFVTNSSSTSTLIVHIEDEKLADIFNRYKEILERCSETMSIKDGNLVLHLFSPESGSTVPPTSNKYFVDSLIDLLVDDCWLDDVSEDFYDDLRENEDEIIATLKNVKWEYCDERKEVSYSFDGQTEKYEENASESDDEDYDEES